MNTSRAFQSSSAVRLAICAAITGGRLLSQASDPGQPAHWHAAPTPPMGWNSYDNFGSSVTEAEMLANAQFMHDKLQTHGWNYVVVDYRWSDATAAHHDLNGNGGPLEMDEYGRLVPAPSRFPSAAGGQGFKPLADRIHALGLKFGIHVMRGIARQSVKANTPIEGSTFHAVDAANTRNTCGWCGDMYGVEGTKPAGQAWYDSLFRQYAAWGVDFVKVDDLSSPYSDREIEAIRRAIDRCGREMVFSTSPGETPPAQAAHVEAHANMWRISGDFWDTWAGLNHTFDLLVAWQGHGGPGHWPDADMLPLGHIGTRSVDGSRTTRFTRDEQVTLMTLWALAPSPLMLGGDLPASDEWTLSLLTNDAVLAVNQDPLGKQARPISRNGELEVWVKELSGGAKAVGFFNRSGSETIDASRAVFKSPLVTRETPGQSVPVEANISGAKKLYLVVDDGGDNFNCDHADWLEPKLIGAQGELKLTSLKWVSAISGWGTVAVGKSTSGRDLLVGKQKYAEGIGTHAQSIIEYDLPPGYETFTARGGLDEGGVSQKIAGATVHFLVFTNDPHSHGNSATIAVAWKDLRLLGPCRVRDLWTGKEAVVHGNSISREVPAHGAVLLRLEPLGDL